MTTDTEILYGFHPVAECLRAGRRRVLEIVVARQARGQRVEALMSLADERNVPVRRCAREEIRHLAVSEAHQDVCARVASYPLVDLAALLDSTAAPLLLLLDQVVDVQNFGSLVRTALCAGVKGVVIPRRRAAQPGAAACKASAGALEHMPVARVANMTAAVKDLKAAGFWIAGLDGRAEQAVFDVDLTGPLAMVIGGEHRGIRPLVRRHCDLLAAIPQQGPLDSLNASAAGAVALFESVRQRRAESIPD